MLNFLLAFLSYVLETSDPGGRGCDLLLSTFDCDHLFPQNSPQKNTQKVTSVGMYLSVPNLQYGDTVDSEK